MAIITTMGSLFTESHKPKLFKALIYLAVSVLCIGVFLSNFYGKQGSILYLILVFLLAVYSLYLACHGWKDYLKEPEQTQGSELAMRFFTMNWWLGVQEGKVFDPGPLYAKHIDQLRQNLPAENQATLDALLGVSLHDSELKELQLLPEKDCLLLDLKHFDCVDEVLIHQPDDDISKKERTNPFLGSPIYEMNTCSVRVSITYSGVRRFAVMPSLEGGLCGPCGFGELGYCEVDRTGAGTFIHRILFSSGITIAIEFDGFEYKRSRLTE